MRKLLPVILIFLIGCNQMQYNTVLVMKNPINFKIKVIDYCFPPDMGEGILICYTDSLNKEIIYSFKTQRCARFNKTEWRSYPDYPDKEVKCFYNKSISSKIYKAVWDTSSVTPEIYLNKVDSFIFYKVIPILTDIPNIKTDSIEVPKIKGYVKDIRNRYYPVKNDSYFKKVKLK